MEEWRSRLELLSLEDSSPRSLAKKLLSGARGNHNKALDRLKMIARESSPNEALGLVCVFPTKQIEQVARAIGTLPKFEAEKCGEQKKATELCLVFGHRSAIAGKAGAFLLFGNQERQPKCI